MTHVCIEEHVIGPKDFRPRFWPAIADFKPDCLQLTGQRRDGRMWAVHDHGASLAKIGDMKSALHDATTDSIGGNNGRWPVPRVR